MSIPIHDVRYDLNTVSHTRKLWVGEDEGNIVLNMWTDGSYFCYKGSGGISIYTGTDPVRLPYILLQHTR